ALGREIGEVHLKVSQEVISRVVLANAVKVSLIALAALIAGILFTVLPVNYIINPIKELEKGVKALGEGNYDIVITSYSNDEIGDLTSAFNATAKSLKEKDLLKGAFSAYMPSSVMDEILKDPSKPSLHGNRLKATMLFTDIRGFTSMSDELEPEQLVNVINAYFTVQTDKVFKWKGLFDKFVGNCIMAVFGIPFPQPDDSYRAVRTALDIKEGVDALNEIRQKSGHRTVHIGIGINTGEVFAGNMGTTQKMGYTVIGDNVNLAASLELNAPGGHIYVSESTYIETKDRIEYAKLEPIMVKGKKDPVKVFEPTGLKLQKVINAGK
ncbi:MAG TPA: adenylate/guanylate cyclase domain-containing protein, partial [Candidatus Goldiibacteriota bacterium]|nr:adenylate/guanylate cyclase domain-containing protein [Candidatus Goldiibacteriota bacterium]